jgi:serine protease inhibitor
MRFAAKLFDRVVAKAGEEANVFVSPYSVSSALAVVLAGAKGATAAQLRNAIGYGAEHDDELFHNDTATLIYEVPLLNTARGSCLASLYSCNRLASHA